MRVSAVVLLLVATSLCASPQQAGAVSMRERVLAQMRGAAAARQRAAVSSSAAMSVESVQNADGSTTHTACVKVLKVEATHEDLDNDGMLSPGDCLRYPADMLPIPQKSNGVVSTSSLPDGSGRTGQFTMNTTCQGVTLTTVLDPSEDMSAMPSSSDPSASVNKTCPEGHVAVQATVAAAASEPESRITTTTGRGIGLPVSSCDQYGSNYEKDGGLCYPKCRSGYTGSGPLCLENCPSGFRNDGLYCAKPRAYGRGGGSNFGLGSCPRGKERNGLLCYPICRTNFHATGCCICSPNCPSGMTDIGVSCQKGSYGRGVGRPLKCPSGSDYDAGLCYRQCPSGAHGVGPLCYAPCTSDQPYRLGIWCYHDEGERNRILGAIVGGVLGGAIIAGAVALVTAPIVIAATSSAVVAGPLGLSASFSVGPIFTPVASLSLAAA